MDISTKHADAVTEACRVPGLHARLALLVQPLPGEPERSVIELYGTSKPTPGDPPGGSPVVSIPLTAAAGTVDEPQIQLALATPIEAQVTGADATTGTIPTWARVLDVDGDWWADLTVSVEGGGGEIELAQTGTESAQPVARLFNGAIARITSAIIQG